MGTFSGSDRLHGVDGHIKTIPEGASTAVKKAGWFSKGGSAEGEVLARVSGHYDRVLFITPTGGPTDVLMDLSAARVAPKYVLPLSLQGPWESRRLWQFATSELLKRPVVDWAAVDREKAQLEEEQRLVPCHNFKPGTAGYADWATKRFHTRPMPDLVAGGPDKDLFVFDEFSRDKFKPGEPEKNLLHLSRTLPDVRGGLHGAGALLRGQLPVELRAATRSGAGLKGTSDDATSRAARGMLMGHHECNFFTLSLDFRLIALCCRCCARAGGSHEDHQAEPPPHGGLGEVLRRRARSWPPTSS
jgi:hypothetical protein